MSGADVQDWQVRLGDLRRTLGWSQRRLAREFRVTPGAVSQWESGQRNVPGPARRLIEIYEQRLGMIDGPSAGLEKLNSSWVARTLRTSAATARIAATMAGSSLRGLVASNERATEIREASQRAIAAHMVKALGNLKGATMKFGQMWSFMEFGLPPTVREALHSLQDDTVQMTPAALDAVFLESMGDIPERIFDQWEPRAMAAASIGQVHRAVAPDGTPVAVKVQYPKIRETVKSDLRNFKAFATLASVIYRGVDVKSLGHEIEARLNEECDYEQEARNQEEFRKRYAGEPQVVVPRVFTELSTDRILTTELVVGKRFNEFVREADQSARDQAGAVIFRMALKSNLQNGIFNADPHPGNYLFTPDGEVAFIDFGCVKRLDTSSWLDLLYDIAEDNRAAIEKKGAQMMYVGWDDAAPSTIYEMLMTFFEPVLSDRPFRFNRDYMERLRSVLVTDNPDRHRLNTQPDFLFGHRLNWGMYSVLAELEAEANWRGIFEEMFDAIGRQPVWASATASAPR